MLFKAIRHAYRVVHSIYREKQKEKTRSPKWRTVRDDFLKTHKTCAACGGMKRIQVHHVEPFHLKPEMELDEKNLIAMCMGPHEDHIRVGHGDDFKAFNPNVREDAAHLLANPGDRTKIEEKALKSRKFSEGSG